MNEIELKQHLENKSKEQLIKMLIEVHNKLNNIYLEDLSYFGLERISDIIEETKYNELTAAQIAEIKNAKIPYININDRFNTPN